MNTQSGDKSDAHIYEGFNRSSNSRYYSCPKCKDDGLWDGVEIGFDDYDDHPIHFGNVCECGTSLCMYCADRTMNASSICWKCIKICINCGKETGRHIVCIKCYKVTLKRIKEVRDYVFKDVGRVNGKLYLEAVDHWQTCVQDN